MDGDIKDINRFLRTVFLEELQLKIPNYKGVYVFPDSEPALRALGPTFSWDSFPCGPAAGNTV